jgi:hypothetical protein
MKKIKYRLILKGLKLLKLNFIKKLERVKNILFFKMSKIFINFEKDLFLS